jgi:hypothetical protein
LIEDSNPKRGESQRREEANRKEGCRCCWGTLNSEAHSLGKKSDGSSISHQLGWPTVARASQCTGITFVRKTARARDKLGDTGGEPPGHSAAALSHPLCTRGTLRELPVHASHCWFILGHEEALGLHPCPQGSMPYPEAEHAGRGEPQRLCTSTGYIVGRSH